MEVRIASVPGPGRPLNEDFAMGLPGLAAVFDGVSVPAGLDSGCVHGPAWYVRRLGSRLAAGYVRDRDAPLWQQLATAIERVRADHGGRCGLDHPGTPASTNRPDGYWIAAANPRAAYQAITGTLPLTGPHRVRRAALLTDGASCAVDQYQMFDWPGLLDILTDHGPLELIRRVRAAERADHDGRRRPRYKRHDDATAALCLFSPLEGGGA